MHKSLPAFKSIFLRIFLVFALFLGCFPAFADEPFTVEIGMYIVDIAHLDVKESEFFADFYIWYKSPGNASWSPENIEFMNGKIEHATPLSHLKDHSGKNVWSQRVKGTFRGHFRLQAYPFDSQVLPISIEDSEMETGQVVFLPDTTKSADFNTWVEPEMDVPDWQLNGASCTIDVHNYKTDFGLGTNRSSHYSRFTFKVFLKRLFLPHLIKFILPLIIIAGMAYMVFFINASEFEAQCGICITALLSAIALHMSQAEALPAVGYMVMADKIFILFYVVIFSALVQTVINNNYAKKRRFDVAIYLDKVFRVWYVLILLIGNLLVFLFR
ncbi:MAG: hypothetical protein PHD82_14810 [Candidatus Riflebacteria bacterium]|nr:hypothetical protein [Candidatus Riflebacteria bacterium]